MHFELNRRTFGLAALASALPSLALAQDPPFAKLEDDARGRLGVAILYSDGSVAGRRLDERFPMCSTFKWLAAAHVLQRVDRGVERLDRRIAYGRDALQPHSPVTEKHVGAGMTLSQLCEATITVSDNAAANLILGTYGGPSGFTRFVRGLGDEVTRLDRWEPDMSESNPGDARDTTSPRAMAQLLRAVLLGDALSPSSRALLARWMEATETNRTRLRAALPTGWRMGSKTGSGDHGTTNDVGIFWPPNGRPPVIVAAYLTDSKAGDAVRHATIAKVAALVTRG